MGVLLLKQTCRAMSTYTADVSGVASALYELGGLTVIHDASGCNSTYNTHDEPRWYDMPSRVYISALDEMNAVMGTSDEKLLNDIGAAVEQLRPAFVAIAGTPVPMMMGVDIPALARLAEKRFGLPCFGFATNSMHSYQLGVGPALAAIAERFCPEQAPAQHAGRLGVNLLGVTPLDFSITGNVEELHRILNAVRERLENG